MKKVGMLKLLALIVAFFATIPASRAASIVIPDFEIAPGEEVTQTVSINNGQAAMFEYQGLQFDIALPAGISIVKEQTTLLAPLEGFKFRQEVYPDGTSRVVVYTSGNPTTDTEDLMALTFKAAPDIAAGKSTMRISDVVFSDPLGQDVNGENSTTTITVYMPDRNVYLYIDDFEIEAGSTYDATLNIKAEDDPMFEYKGFQFDLTVPSDLSIDLDATALTSTLTGFNWRAEDYGSGHYRFIVYTNGNPTTATENLMTIRFEAAEDAEGGEVIISNYEQIFSSPLGQDIRVLSSTTKVLIIEKEVPPITATIYIPDFTITGGQFVMMPVSVLHEDAPMFTYAGFQFDVAVPEHVTITAARLSSALSSYSLKYENLGNGVYRFVTLGGDQTADQLLTLTFAADRTVPAGVFTLPISNVIFSSPLGTDIKLEDSDYTITTKAFQATVRVTPESATVLVGAQQQFTANVTPVGDYTIVWSSSNPDVATVDQTGKATAVGTGTTTITATVYDKDGNIVFGTGSAQLIVNPVLATGITLNAYDKTIYVEETFQLEATVTPPNTTVKDLLWISDNPRIATVSQTGLVTGIAPGVANITVTCGNVSATCKVTVVEEEEVIVQLNPGALDLLEGETGHIDATVYPEDIRDDVTIRWTTSDPDVATVDENGNVTAVGEGECEITATVVDSEGNELASATAKVTVNSEPEVTVTVSPEEMELEEGDSAQLEVQVDGSSELPEGWYVEWNSSNPDVADVDDDGNVTAVGEGSATVTGTVYDENGNVMGEASCDVTVKGSTKPEPEVTVTPPELELEEGESGQLEVEVDGSTELPDGWHVEWNTSNPDVADVDEDGNVTAKGEGSATVTGTVYDENGNVVGEASCDITVTPATPPTPGEVDVTVTPGELDLEEGMTGELTVTTDPEELPEGTHLVWTSSNPDVATVDEDGNVTAVGEGDCTITVQVVDEDGNVLGEASSDITVWPKGVLDNGPVPDGWYGNNNGTYVSALKIREGNELGLGVNEPKGGYMAEWAYMWLSPDGAQIGDEREIWIPAELKASVAASAGLGKAISDNVYTVEVINEGPAGEAWTDETLQTAMVEVYKRPATPTQLLRKGDGTSCTFVVMMTPLDNQQILDLGYSYVYGYYDANGNSHELERTERRYTHTTYDIYNNSSYTFWAYSLWTYPDGSIVSSGLRYLDGSEDAEFDASEFTTRSSSVNAIEAEGEIIGIYTLDGRFAGKEPTRLEPGIYIIRSTNSATKVVVK